MISDLNIIWKPLKNLLTYNIIHFQNTINLSARCFDQNRTSFMGILKNQLLNLVKQLRGGGDCTQEKKKACVVSQNFLDFFFGKWL